MAMGMEDVPCRRCGQLGHQCPVVPSQITVTVDEPGPLARAMLSSFPCEYCHHARRDHHDSRGVCCATLECPCKDYIKRSCDCGARDCSYCRFDSHGEQRVSKQPSPRPAVANLLRDVAAGIRVLRTYGVEITEEQVTERANNIVQGLLGNYTITGTGE